MIINVFKCRRMFLAGVVLVAPLAVLATWSPAKAGSKVYVGRNVPANRRISMDQIDHVAWDQLLKKYVDARGNVNYANWQRSAADQRALDDYLKRLSTAGTEVRASRAAQLAFWINAYNAVTIKGILREYPTTSIRNHTAKVFGYNVWNDLLLYTGGQTYSLNAIEHEVLRKMKEPRIHFAIVCASISCPRLRNEAYTATRLEAQLADNTTQFFANPLHFRYDTANRRFYLSSILKWFGDDFGTSPAEVLRTIARFLPNQDAQQAALNNAVTVSYLDYDWGLNDQATANQATANRSAPRR